MKKHLYPIVYSVLLLGFTTFIALNTFVLGATYQESATEMNTAMFEAVESPATTNPETIAAPETTSISTSTEANRNTPADAPETEVSADVAETDSAGETSDTAPEFSAVDPGDGTVIGTYSDENIQITLVQSRAYDSTVYWADVQVTSAEYLKTAFAQDSILRHKRFPRMR